MPLVKDIPFRREVRPFLPVIVLILLFFFFLDKPLIQAVRDFHAARPAGYSVIEFINPFIDFISHGATQIVVALCLLAGGMFFRHRIQRVGWSLTVGFISSGLTAQLLKHLLGRARPRITDETIFTGPTFQGGYDSFPSGHTTTTFCLAFILAHYFPRYSALFYFYAVVTGFDRIEGLSHFPSDVLAGMVIGIMVGSFVIQKVRYPWPYRYAGEELKQNG